MRIKRLDLLGFKSFPDKTTLVFDRSIVGIVGPNGCGKSNLVDAMRWVMGEQSVKALRGHAREDVIFAGSEHRRAMGLSEVTLTFDNADKLAPSAYNAYDEISVTRKLYRDGTSEYLVNGANARLKDITDLFLGTGAGTKAYSIIEQDQVALVINARPEDRRMVIEEAAGITKYHARRREAERKIDSTRQNLLRIRDVISELKRQLDSLGRQARKAERYREMKARYKDLDLRFSSRERVALERDLSDCSAGLTALEEDLAGLIAQRQAKENEAEARSLRLEEMERIIREGQERLNRVDQQMRLDERNLEVFADEERRLLDRAGEIEREAETLTLQVEEQRRRVEELESEERTIQTASQERESLLAQAQSRHQQSLTAFNALQQEIERIKREVFAALSDADRVQNRQETLRQRIGDNQERTVVNRRERQEIETGFVQKEEVRTALLNQLGSMRQEKIHFDEEREGHQALLNGERERLVAIDDDLANERERLARTTSRLQTLSELDTALEGFEEAVRHVMQGDAFDPGERIDVLARRLHIDAGFESAAAAALSDRLQWVICRDAESARKGVRHLHATQAGRAGFVPLPSPVPPFDPPEPPPGAARLSDHVRGLGEAAPVLERLLSSLLFAASLDEAARWVEQGGGYWGAVTADGTVCHPNGAVVGGSGEGIADALLKRRREMEDLARNQEGLTRSVEQFVALRAEQARKIEDLTRRMEDARQQGHNQEIRILEQERDLQRIEAEMRHLQQRGAALDREYGAYQQEMERFLQEKRDLELSHRDAAERQGAAETRLRSAQERLESLARNRDEAAQELADERVRHAESAQRRQHIQTEGRSARERERDLSSRLQQLLGEKGRGVERRTDLFRLNASTRETLAQRQTERETLAETLRLDRERLETSLAEHKDLAEAIKSTRSRLEQAQEAAAEKRLKQSELTLSIRHLSERVFEKYGITLATEQAEYLDGDAPGAPEREEMDALRDRLEKMGEVNMASIAEHEQVSERYLFLCNQEDDLTRSLDMLEEAIAKINKTTRKRFKETFEEVNRRFSELFPQIFGGGEARMVLTDPDDLLNTGIEILAKPPGKANVQSVSLSGGEKALTAVSLIFSIFLYRPTPFCLLDEVDAPLDDVNIGRFNSLVRRISRHTQFILITHNKKTMEITNRLYGVTMEEPGISKIVSVNLT